jgi:hypothetical protein
LERIEVATKGFFSSWWWLILVGLVIGGALGAADWLGGSPLRAVTDVAIVAGYSLILTVLRSRSETASVLAGLPVDERWQAINLHALATAGVIGALVALGGFGLAVATGHDGSGFAIVAGAVGISYIGSVIWYRSRL